MPRIDPPTAHRPVAIIGIGCLLPGAHSPEQFWNNLAGGVDSRSEAGREVFGTDPDVPGGWGDAAHEITAIRGGFVTEPEFDLTGMHVPAEQLGRLDRVVRWSLHVARAALADAGVAETDPVLARTGLALGNYSFPTDQSVRMSEPLLHDAVSDGLRLGGIAVPESDHPATPVDPHNLWAAGLPATVLGDALALGGPALSLDAACSSALYGLSLARDYLDSGEADLMLAGAVCVPDPLLIHLSFSDLGAFPVNGVSQPFGDASSGILTGQGAGVFVLKRLADAERDGDRIHAVIDAVGLSNDGAGKHVLSPNLSGQLEAYERAYRDSGIDPSTVDYVECHATGTPLGDSVELRGLSQFFGADPAHAVPPLGSVKGNVGHLLTVAGFTSALKVVLAMTHGTIPATLGVGERIQVPDTDEVVRRVVVSAQPWPDRRTSGPGMRRAAVSAFGFGGTNAHVVLSTPPAAGPAPDTRPATAPPAMSVVGLGIRLGPLSGTDDLGRLVRTAVPLLGARPDDRWYGMDGQAEPALADARGDGDLGSYVDTVDLDVRSHHIPPNELAHANPQHVVFFDAADQALTDAGFPTPDGYHAPRRVAVVVAMEMEPHTHNHRVRFDVGAYVRAEVDRADVHLGEPDMVVLIDTVRQAIHPDLGTNEVLSYIGNVMASRISSARNFTGPSFTVSSDSTVGARALEVARVLLRDPTIEAVLVGSVDLAAGVENTVARARVSVDAHDTLPPLGDGAAAVVVMRPEEVPDGRREYCTIDALSICYAAPHTTAQDGNADSVSRAARESLAAAGVGASDVDHLELGGLTEASSHAELTALAEVYRTDGDGHEGCGVARLGDLSGDVQRASVLAAVVKLALCLHHAELPPAPEGLVLDAELIPGLSRTPWQVATGTRPWLLRRQDDRRVAAISAIGHRGHQGWHAAGVVLSAGRVAADRRVDWIGGPGALLLPLRAADGTGLATLAREHLARLVAGEQPLALVGDAVRGGHHGAVTAVLVAADADALARELEAAQRDLPGVIESGGEWATPAGSFCTAHPLGPDGRIAFVYPGAFTTYPGAGQDLFRLFPALLARFEEQAKRPRDRFKLAALHPAAATRMDRGSLMRHEAELVENIPVMLATGTNFAVLHTSLLRDLLGVRPHGALGYSLGESSMLFATDVWADAARDDAALTASPLFRDQLRGRKEIVRRAWGLSDDLPDKAVWSTHVLLAAADDVRAAMDGLDRVFLTHVNTPGEVVVAGEPASCAEVIARVGCQAAKAPANHVMHNRLVDPAVPDLARLNDYPLGHPDPDLELLSAYDYGRIDPGDRAAIAERIAQTLRTEVDFERLTRTAYERGFRYFVEVGPGATCTRWIAETLKDRPHMAVSIDRRGVPSGVGLARTLARLVAHGVPVDLAVLFGHEDVPPARLTTSVTAGAESIVEQVRRGAETAKAASGTGPAGTAGPAGLEEGIVLDDDLVGLPAPSLPASQPVPARPAGPAPRPAQLVPAPRPVPVRQTVAVARPKALVGALAPARSTHLQSLAATVVAAHRSTLRAHDAIQQQMLDRIRPAAPVSRPPQPPPPPAPGPAKPDGVLFDEADLLEFARGRVSDVFGPRFAEIDGFAYRVRLPIPPYLFVTRVTELHGETGVFEPSTITTEFDIPVDAWFLVDGLAPTAVTVEAGQCDLLLISYLGIDFETRGERRYRLLDSTLTFHAGFPRGGQTVRYEISIDRFVRNGDTLLFFFSYRCFADGELILELSDACAGFFTAAELDDSLGVVPSAADRIRREAMSRTWFTPLARTDRTSLSAADLDLLAQGRLADVFGAEWDQSADGANPSIRLPGAQLRIIDEVTSIDRLGGPRGLGELVATTELDPDGWYFPCHFPGDPVLAGSLVAEGGVQLLQTYAMFLGLHMVLPNAEFQTVPGLRTGIKVRGQILPTTPRLRYHAEITEITLLPRPTLIADLTVYDGDKPIIAIHDFGIQVREKPGTPYRPGPGGVPPFLGRRNHSGEPAFINELHLAHAAKGDLAVTMGPEFEIYHDHRAPHIPNGDFRFVDRIMTLDGTRGVLTPGATMVSEYDAPPEAWYFHENASAEMPNCVRMESSLQAAILLGYYLGATLTAPEREFSIRNLDGHATLLRDVELRGRTVRHTSVMLSSQTVPGTVLQKFSYELSVDGEMFYRGESMFGYFAPEALVVQVGLDGGRYQPPWLDGAPDAEVRTLPVRSDERWFVAGPGAPRLADGHMLLLDDVDIVLGGGDHDLGYARGRRRIRPDEWYFACHFHRDPVMPGSLGVESAIQALQVLVREQGLAHDVEQPVFTTPLDVEMVWSYRGQILRSDHEMTVDVHVTEVRRDPGRVVVVADANVWRTPESGVTSEGLRIYRLTGLAVEIRSGTPQGEEQQA